MSASKLKRKSCTIKSRKRENVWPKLRKSTEKTLCKPKILCRELGWGRKSRWVLKKLWPRRAGEQMHRSENFHSGLRSGGGIGKTMHTTKIRKEYEYQKNVIEIWKKIFLQVWKTLPERGFLGKLWSILCWRSKKKMLWLRRTHVSQKAAISGKLMQDDWIRPGKKSVKVSRNGERAWLIKKNVVQRAHKIVIHKDAWLSYC